MMRGSVGLPEVNGDHDVDDGNTLTVIANGDDGDASKRAGVTESGSDRQRKTDLSDLLRV